MTRPTFIWDFDGTLADSYEAIEQALEVTYAHYQLPFDRDRIMAYIIETSVGQLLREIAAQDEIDWSELKAFFSQEQEARDHLVTLMPGAKAVLEKTTKAGIQHFIYTHKGATTDAVLKDLGIDGYFTEVVTSANGFERKPHPEGIDYLVTKYQLDKASTYYIGDRSLDVKVAENAGIKSINLHQPASAINQKINQLSDLLALFVIE
ncbi:HAD-IA family hydrolase [Streptococcus plurextorum]|uniref:HAD-IA family hydrolase n=1 Tax=Streptococcus plurextorum TaxID=456876 RepID=UPI00040F93B6|nr:HAD-IA family hydrolase [Streptococcus plurextorum]